MKHGKLNENTHALRLDPGEDVHSTLQAFCAENKIDNASVEGIGSVDSPVLAHYSKETMQFTDRPFAGIYEVISLLGNVALVDGTPFAHLHATVAGPDMQAFGGHLVKGVCSATLELIVTAYSSHHSKTQNNDIGLKVWDFGH